MGGLGLFVLGHIVIYFVDGRLQQKMVVRLREKVKKIEVKTQGVADESGKRALGQLNQDIDEQQALKPSGRSNVYASPGGADEGIDIEDKKASKSNGFGKGPSKKRLKKSKKKTKDQDADLAAEFEGGSEDGGDFDAIGPDEQVEQEKKKKKSKKSKKKEKEESGEGTQDKEDSEA
jgi:hypothetical protein